MERNPDTRDPVKAPYRLANTDWALYIFWTTYFSIIIIIIGVVAYVTV